MICDDNKGKMTFGEVLGYNLGLLQYLWVKAMKNLKRMKGSTNKSSGANSLAEVIADL
jgi:hypothetical protein